MPDMKPHEFDRMLRSGGSLPRMIVIYGPDKGLVSERAALAARKSGIALDDPFALVRLDASDVQKDAGRLIDEVNGLGLFGGSKLVWLKGAMNEKGLVDALQSLTQTPPDQSYLIVEAGDLKKGAALRKVAETSREVVSVACYADDERALNELIDGILQEEGKRITPAARELLIANLGGDRIASRGEVRKLALYCLQEQQIEEHHVREIIGDASATSIDDAIDALLQGDREGMIRAVQSLLSAKTAIYQLLNAVLRQFQTLDTLRAEMDRSGMSAAQVVGEHGRHIFFKRKPIITSALNVWTTPKLSREMARLQATILTSQKNASISDSIALQLMLSLALQSTQRR